jgi:glycosyltransferase involved in cell wall biosynthesis
MIALCQGYDVGLAIEPGFSQNNRLALSNKAFTYMLAGLAVALTNTPGQRCLIDDLGPDAIGYEPGDASALAAGLTAWGADRGKLLRAKQAAWEAAQRRWHWEHAQERGALLEAVDSVLAHC